MKPTIKRTLISLSIIVFLTIVRKTDFFGLIQLDSSITSTWINEIKFWVFLGLFFLVVLKIERTPFLLWQETKRKWYFYLFSITIIFTGAVVVGVTVPLVFKFLNISLKQDVLESVSNHYCSSFILLVFGCLTAGVVEELVFRGYLMPRLEIFAKNGWLVIVLSSLIFGFAHLGNLSIVGLVVPTFIGLIFSYHYYKYRNIVVLILAHFLIDFASFMTSC